MDMHTIRKRLRKLGFEPVRQRKRVVWKRGKECVVTPSLNRLGSRTIKNLSHEVAKYERGAQ